MIDSGRAARIAWPTLGLTLLMFGLIACGGDSGPAATTQGTTPGATTAAKGVQATSKPAKPGTTIKLGPSQFGKMLFDGRNQAIYLFAKEKTSRPECYGDCAKAWPPVLTKGKPVAKNGTRKSLLGTTKRRGGGLQVTYKGHPLYFYAHEKPRQVLCHNITEFGGLWLVVQQDGNPAPA